MCPVPLPIPTGIEIWQNQIREKLRDFFGDRRWCLCFCSPQWRGIYAAKWPTGLRLSRQLSHLGFVPVSSLRYLHLAAAVNAECLNPGYTEALPSPPVSSSLYPALLAASPAAAGVVLMCIAEWRRRGEDTRNLVDLKHRIMQVISWWRHRPSHEHHRLSLVGFLSTNPPRLSSLPLPPSYLHLAHMHGASWGWPSWRTASLPVASRQQHSNQRLFTHTHTSLQFPYIGSLFPPLQITIPAYPCLKRSNSLLSVIHSSPVYQLTIPSCGESEGSIDFQHSPPSAIHAWGPILAGICHKTPSSNIGHPQYPYSYNTSKRDSSHRYLGIEDGYGR